ncbi:MAG: hypothetical protein QHH24_01440 [Candidatus Bathyarchaeota archaeon]|nr:hypothetical protein [Candidatus Bathyarchaeota archaeon]
MTECEFCSHLMLHVLFALNKEFLPPQKWRIFYSYGLHWLPKDYRKLVEEIMTIKSFSKRGLDRRIQALQAMWKRCSIKSDIVLSTSSFTSLGCWETRCLKKLGHFPSKL